jgi:large subunit ribosomal protein L13e
MVKHNYQLPNAHFRKHWSRFVKSWFDQPANKKRRSQNRQAKAAAVFPRPVELLRPLVNGSTRRYSSKIRYGRGFSLQELAKAKISPAFARTVGIAVDHRRHDASEEKLQLNVQRLESYKSKLILFPRRADKPKKGDIADSTADKLKSASAGNQNTSKHVVEKPRRKVRQTPAKITKEMTATKIFRKLRQLRVNEKYKGKREKKAKDDAAKEK